MHIETSRSHVVNQLTVYCIYSPCSGGSRICKLGGQGRARIEAPKAPRVVRCGEGCPSILDLKMTTSGALWTLLLYSSAACLFIRERHGFELGKLAAACIQKAKGDNN